MLRRRSNVLGISLLRLSYLWVALASICLVGSLVPCQLWAQSITLAPVITTVAGTGTGGYDGDMIPAAGARLNMPIDLAVDSAGNLYISDFYNQRVRKVDASGTITTVAGSGTAGYNGDGIPAISAQLNYPAGLAIDSTGNLYIADVVNNRIRKVDVNGMIATVAGTGNMSFSGDNGLAVNAALSFPTGVALDSAGNLYIVDQQNNRIRKVDGSGIITTIAGIGTWGYNGDNIPATTAQLNYPQNLLIDSVGDLYIVDSLNSRIRKVDTNGIITTVAGVGTNGYSGDNGPATSAELYYPAGLAIGSSGNLYIADQQNHCIRRVDASGTITTVAGTGVAGYNGDNIQALNAQLNHPEGLALDTSGNLYIADVYNHRVRKLSQGPINVGAVNVHSSITQNVFLSVNTPLTLSSVQASADYSVLSNSCPMNTPLSANTICTLQVKFAPYLPGQRWSPLVVTDDLSNKYSFGLEGLGIGPALGFTPGIIGTIAGTGTLGYSGDNGPATSAELNYPFDVAVDSVGNLYIADQLNSRIRKVNTSGVVTTVAGSGNSGYAGDNGPATSAAFDYPTGVALDSMGNLYIADYGNARIRKVDINGIVTTVAGNGTWGYSGDNGPATSAEFWLPQSVAVDSVGNLYIADSYNCRIRKVNTSGIITTVAGNGSPGSNGDNIPATSAELYYPYDVAVDSAGNLYIADFGGERIRKVDTNGIITTVAGKAPGGYGGDNGPATEAELNGPAGLAVDSAGNLYFVDQNNYRVRKVDVSGIITTVAGNGTAGYSGDNGSATTAEINGAYGVAVDGAGTLYIADLLNSRIRMVDVGSSALSFSSLGVGLASNQQTLTVSDVGNATLDFYNFSVSSDFLLQSVDNDCRTGTALTSGTSCALGLVFSPSTPSSPQVGLLVIDDNAFNGKQVALLTGIILATPTVSFTGAPVSASFGSTFTVVATTDASTTAVITASGACSIAGTTVTMTGGTGACSLTANWAADSNYLAASLSQSTTATMASSAIGSISNSPNPSTVGQQVKVSFTVTGAAGVPTGSVTVTATTGESCNGGLTAGAGSCPLTFTTAGSRTLTATYLGDGNFNGSSSTGVSQGVAAASIDLVESSVLVLTSGPISGGSISVADTVTNQGSANASGSWTGFYLSSDGTTKGSLLGTRGIPGVTAGASSSGKTNLTLPVNLNGTYYIIVCADYSNLAVESNETNNCTASSGMQVAAADLLETSVTAPSSAVSGGGIQVSDKVANQGLGNAGGSWTGFYLSSDGTTKGSLLGTRGVPGVAAGGSSSGKANLTLPVNLNGTYYIIACADYSNLAVESNETNNCIASTSMQVAAADLLETSLTAPASAVSGGKLQVSDTVANQGLGNAGGSWTGFYLSTDGIAKSSLLGTRGVPGVAAGSSSSGNTNLTIPGKLSGTYYVIACVDYANNVVESDEANNCIASSAITVH